MTVLAQSNSVSGRYPAPRHGRAASGSSAAEDSVLPVALLFAFPISEKGREADEPHAKSVGNGRVGTRRIKGGQNMVRSATGALRTNPGPATNSGPNEEDSLSERFSALIIPLPVKVVAKIAAVSTETVKAWRKARQMPQAEHLFRLAKKIPSVRAFLYSEVDPSLESPRAMQALYSGLQYIASKPGPDGEAARALLRGATGRDGQ